MSVEELIERLLLIEDKTKLVEIPEHYTEGYYTDIKYVEEFEWGIQLIG